MPILKVDNIHLEDSGDNRIELAANDILYVSTTDGMVISGFTISNPVLTVSQIGDGPALVVEDSTNPDATPFIIVATGNVGINTSTPLYELDVPTGTINVSSIIVNEINVTKNIAGVKNIETENVSAVKIDVLNNSTDNAIRITQKGSGNVVVIQDDSPDATPFVIDSTGNVAIGKGVPSYKVDVVGTVNATNFFKNGVPIQEGGMDINGGIFSISDLYHYLTMTPDSSGGGAYSNTVLDLYVDEGVYYNYRTNELNMTRANVISNFNVYGTSTLRGGTVPSGGFSVTSYNLGTGAGTITVDPALGNYQYITNNGGFTFAAPTTDCGVDILVTNGASAGGIGLSGFTVRSGGTGDTYVTTNGHRYILSIRRIAGISTYLWKALQ